MSKAKKEPMRARVRGVQETPDGVRVHMDRDGVPVLADLSVQEAGSLILALMDALTRRGVLVRLKIPDDGISILVGADNGDRPQPVRMRTVEGAEFMLDLSWPGAEQLQDLTEGLLAAASGVPGRRPS